MHIIVRLLPGHQNSILSTNEWHHNMNPALISAVMAPNLKIKEITAGTRWSIPIPNQNMRRCPRGQRANPCNVAQHINGNNYLINMGHIPRIPQVSNLHMPPKELMGMESMKCVIKNGKWGQWLKGSQVSSKRISCTTWLRSFGAQHESTVLRVCGWGVCHPKKETKQYLPIKKPRMVIFHPKFLHTYASALSRATCVHRDVVLPRFSHHCTPPLLPSW